MLNVNVIMLNIERIGINLRLCRVPAHTGVEGNEIADLNALKLKDNGNNECFFGKGEAKSLITT